MKPLSGIGIVLIGAGVIALAVGRFSYTTEEKVLEVGPVVATTDQEHTIHIPDVAGIVAVIAGIALVAMGRRRA